MKLKDIIAEDATNTGASDYAQMQSFVRANKVQGVPPDQQVALALFRELQKQKQQNAQLSSELDAAEQRIDQATQSGRLQSQELGMHKGELEKERKRGEQQKAEVGKLGQAYAEREQASQDQIQDLTNKLEAIKSKPGVDSETIKKIERQIKEINQQGVAADEVNELKRSIDAIQQQKNVDMQALDNLEQQLKDAQETAQNVQDKMGDLQSYKKEIADLKAEVDSLEYTLIKNITPTIQQQQKQLQQVDQTTKQLYAADTKNQAVNKIQHDAAKASMAQAGFDSNKLRALLPVAQQQQLDLPIDSDETQQQQLPLRESKWQNAISWATGK